MDDEGGSNKQSTREGGQGKKRKEEGKEKKGKKAKADGRVFGLFRHTATIKEVVEMLLKKIQKLKSHTYNAYCQWHAHSQNQLQMDESTAAHN